MNGGIWLKDAIDEWARELAKDPATPPELVETLQGQRKVVNLREWKKAKGMR